MLVSPSSRMMCIAVSLLCTASFTALGQSMTDTLREVQVPDVRDQRKTVDDKAQQFAPGQKKIVIDSVTMAMYRDQSVATLLSQQVPVFIKSYGFNNLATLNFRGSSAAQSTVLWNGVPLQNAALGIADVSLLQVGMTDNVSVVYGSSAALWGSGNVGGALLLENNAPVFTERTNSFGGASIAAGSFGRYRFGGHVGLSANRWYTRVQAFAEGAQNNYSYTDAFGAPQRMPNAALKGMGGIAQIGYKAGARSYLNLLAWYQRYDRQIPPALFESSSIKELRDESLRLLLEWQQPRANGGWYIKTSFIQDRMRYEDSAVLLTSNNKTYMSFAEAGWQRQWGRHHKLMLFVPGQLSLLKRNDTAALKQQTRIALAAAYTYSTLQNKLQASANLRAERIDDKNLLLPGVNAAYSPWKWIRFRANVQRTYRAPTLNELYYNPGGNPNLLPEDGWGADAGYHITLHFGENILLEHDIDFYTRRVDDWIAWFGGAIWTPHNIASVHSRGAEISYKFQWQIRQVRLHIGTSAAYIRATTVSSYVPGDASIGKQIPYTPRYQAQGNVGLQYKGIYLNYNHFYAGYRFVTVDESQYLEPYDAGNVQAMYTFRRLPLTLSAQCQNVWNARYNVVAYRPMPGTHWLASIKWDF